MLRAVSVICVESQSLQLITAARRDVYNLFRTSTYSTAASTNETVVRSDRLQAENERAPVLTTSSSSSAPLPSRPPPPPPLPPPPPPARRAWTVAAAALALTASLGGVYYLRKQSDDDRNSAPSVGGDEAAVTGVGAGASAGKEEGRAIPASGDALPRHVQYLLVGAGTASFAAMRAIRSHRPHAQVLMVGEEPQLPYMRPPLSKELWREPDLSTATDLDALTFRQWNGRTRSVSYEPAAFYTPVEELGAGGADGGGGAAVARGWRVVRLDAARHEAELRAEGCEPVVLTYDKCLVATGVRPRRSPALRSAARAGLALALRGAGDARRLAAALEDRRTATVALVGGGFLATELAASLADKVRDSGKTVVQMYREEAPLAHVLPPYLAAEAARRLRDAGVTLLPRYDVVSGEVAEVAEGAEGERGRGVVLRAADGREVRANLVVECVGGEPDAALAAASGLELHPELGGVLVNAELQARTDLYAAGDVACFYDVALGRRRVEHHDHAVASGRRAGENMAAGADLPLTPRPYTHQSMFWSDLGPHLGYEAIGIIDSRLPTVGVFSADAVTDASAAAGAVGSAGAADEGEGARRYERGVVFYVRGKRVVGVLLWNLFNRMHLARQVLAQGEFEDLFEVAKLFALNESEQN